MTDHEIAALPVASLAHPEGFFLFLWVTRIEAGAREPPRQRDTRRSANQFNNPIVR
jgi:hypothetical protein